MKKAHKKTFQIRLKIAADLDKFLASVGIKPSEVANVALQRFLGLPRKGQLHLIKQFRVADLENAMSKLK